VPGPTATRSRERIFDAVQQMEQARAGMCGAFAAVLDLTSRYGVARPVDLEVKLTPSTDDGKLLALASVVLLELASFPPYWLGPQTEPPTRAPSTPGCRRSS
jgi:hypothetical protein